MTGMGYARERDEKNKKDVKRYIAMLSNKRLERDHYKEYPIFHHIPHTCKNFAKFLNGQKYLPEPFMISHDTKHSAYATCIRFELCQALMIFVEKLVMLSRLRSPVQHIYVLLLHWK
jgi:hypothetical protein